MEKSPIFEKTYQDYLNRIADLNLKELETPLGIRVSGGQAVIPFWGRLYTVGRQGIQGLVQGRRNKRQPEGDGRQVRHELSGG